VLTRAAALSISLLVLTVACGPRATADDAAFHSAVTAGRSGAEVTVDGALSDAPQSVAAHEHLLLAVPTGERLEVDHNTRLAPWVPASTGDRLVVHGQLYLDARGPGVHCTHQKTSSGCPQSGWIQLNGKYYE
jgi:Protein of unknown function (DUF3465)